jgi:large subunit ribosomal protein L21
MYAVIVTGGKQYRVAQGDRLRVEKIGAAVGERIELGEVRLLSKDDGLVLDSEALRSAKVIAEVTGEGKRKKIRVYKKKRRKNYARVQGHRQLYTEVLVREIQA